MARFSCTWAFSGDFYPCPDWHRPGYREHADRLSPPVTGGGNFDPAWAVSQLFPGCLLRPILVMASIRPQQFLPFRNFNFYGVKFHSFFFISEFFPLCCSKKLCLTSQPVTLFPLHGPSALAFSFPRLSPPPPVVLSLSITLEAFPDLHRGVRPPYLHFSERSTYMLCSRHFSTCLAPLSVTRPGRRLSHCL